jgi:hypothetical protein
MVAVAALPVMLIPAVPGPMLEGDRFVKFEPLPAKEAALTIPLIVWFPVNVLLPLVTATPDSLTVWLIEAELDVKVDTSGLYWAEMLKPPIPSESASSTETVALPQTTVAVPRTVAPLEKVTVPVGGNANEGGKPDEEVTAALNPTGSPAVAGFWEEVRVVVVARAWPENGVSWNTVPPPLAPPCEVVP